MSSAEDKGARTMDPGFTPSLGFDDSTADKLARLTVFFLLVLIAVVLLDLVSPLGFLDALLGKSHCNFRMKAPTDIREIETALERYAIQHGGRYPARLELLRTPSPEGDAYIECVPRDLWGRHYLYRAPLLGHSQPRICTYGRDGRPGGQGDDADVDNLTLVNRR